MTKPIRPEEVKKYKVEVFPREVFETINELIISRYVDNGTRIIIKQKEITKLLCEKLVIERNEVFDKGYLNFEEVCRASGWDVKYFRPDYTENWDSYFEFRAKK